MNLETITLAGGCFWCTEAIFRRLKGVKAVTSGYANGNVESPTYEDVSSGQSGYAEAIQVTFDPAVIKLQHILDIFWATHDPTSLNRQGNDIGTQYRSAIYYTSDEQRQVAEESMHQAESQNPGQKFVTEIAPLNNFYTAEDYHQSYYEINKNKNPYCSIVIDPKIHK